MARCSLPPSFINAVRSGRENEVPLLMPGIEETPNVTSSKPTPKKISEAFLDPEPVKPRFKSLRERNLWIGVGVGLALALGGVPLVALQRSNPTEASSTAISASQSVTVATVETASVERTLEAAGSIAALELIPVFSQADGLQIQQVLVEEGEWVKQGQAMARLNNSLLQAQLKQAEASVAEAEARLAEVQAGSRSEEIAQAEEMVTNAEAEVAQAQLDLELAKKRGQRNQMLAEAGAIARDRLDEVVTQERNAQLNLEQSQARLGEAKQKLAQLHSGSRQEVVAQAQAQVAHAKAQQQAASAQLKETQVLAPVSGKVAQRTAKVGDLTSTSANLFSIIDGGRLELLLKVPETQLSLIYPGQPVQIVSDSAPSLELSGKVREIEPIIANETRLATVKVDLPANESLKPGMFLQAKITTATASGMIVPSKAVLPQADGSAVVYRLTRDDTVEAQTVETGDLTGERLEIKSGLEPGDRVVVKGAAYLKDGDRVEVIGGGVPSSS